MWSKRRRDREIADEIEAHIAMAVKDRIERGESPREARDAALREFGNVTLVREVTRNVWVSTLVEQFVQDLRFGVRILWQSPGLSLTAAVLIALVIGGNTTIYSLVHGILTAPASGVTADRLVVIAQPNAVNPGFGPYISYPTFLDYAAQSKTVTQLAAWGGERLTLGIEGSTYAAFGGPVTTNFFETFGVAIVKGRSFHRDDDRLENAGLVAIISDRLWRERFQSAVDVVGRPITVNNQPATIIGVAAPKFLGANLTPGEDIWMPITPFLESMGSRRLLTARRETIVLVAGRLAPESSLAQARAEFAAMAAQLASAYRDDHKDLRALVDNYSVTVLLPVGEMAPRFLAIFSVVTLLTLLIVSANVANLMLGRAVIRQRETAVRQSLGASRGRILRMLIAEGAAVSVAAWVAAYIAAWWTARLLVRTLPPSRQNLMPDISPDWTVAAYAMVLAMIATLVFTLAPALRTWRQQVLPYLKAGEQSVAHGRSKLSTALVVMQLAFSVLLLTSAGLAYRSLSLLDSGDIGFDQKNLVLLAVRTARQGNLPPDTRLSASERQQTFTTLERIRERLRDVHNVDAVSYSRRVPSAALVGTTPMWRAGQQESVTVFRRPVGPDYFRVLNLAPLAGRGITDVDKRGSTAKAVINQHLASAVFHGESPIGQTLYVGNNREAVEVVGVVPNALYDGPVRDARPNYVFTAEQQSEGPSSEPKFYVRYSGTLEGVIPSVTKAIADVAPDAPIASIQTMTSALDTVMELERMVASLLVSFAAISLFVAALGQYAITMFNMRRRTRDFGVRMALGASSKQIQRAVVREALQTTGLGLAIGFVLSIGVWIAGRSVLFGVTPTDPATYVGVFALLALASVLASYLPAWRAGRVNVVEALRQE